MAFASVPALDVPPFQLQQLVPLVFDHDVPDSGLGFGSPAPQSSGTPQVTCAQAVGSEIYVGCSDGTLLRYALQANGPDSPESYTLLSRQTLPTNKAIEEIALCPSISRALILSDHQIHFYIIPSLDPVHPSIIRPIRNVISFSVDEQHMRLPPNTEPYQQIEPIEFCVIKRTNIAMYSLKERLVQQREVPNALSIRYGRRNGRYLCAADAENYDMIDLMAATSYPLLPFNQAPDSDTPTRPSVTPISDEEFLVTSNMGPSAMGVFITGNGDPVRGTLEWTSYPVSLCMDYPYVAALLPNHTIEIHSIETQVVVQVIPDSSASEARAIVPSHTGFLVPSTQRTDKLKLVTIRLDSALSDIDVNSLPPSKSSSRPPLFPRSNVLVLSENSIQALLPSTLISQAEALLESHRIDDVVDLADQSQRKMLGSNTSDDELADELRYVYQRIGFLCLSETLFEDAGRHLLAGETDPRLLVRYFPDLRGNVLNTALDVDVYAGIAEHLPRAASIDEIVMADLVKNYAPHIKPDVESAPPTAELRRVLNATARDMLASYLRKYRTRRLLARPGSQPQSASVNAVVDTVLAKILAETDDTTELYTLVDEANDIVVEEVESTFEKNGQYNALCKLYEKAGNEEKLLEAWSKLADGIWTDEDIKDPLAKMTELLNKTSSREQAQRWGLWLTGKDPEIGLKLIISRDSKRVSISDELSLLQRIRESSDSAGVRYLEHLVLQKRRQDRILHSQLVDVYIDQLLQFVTDETTAKLWRAKASSYASSHNDVPFLLYFASTTPESESRNTRLKAALLLQGSNLYDVEKVLARIRAQEKVLRIEMAILYGKLGRHEEAISTLVRSVHDPTSAEAYCTLGGDVIPGKVAWAIGERCGLQRWAALVSGVAPTLGSSASASSMGSGAKVADEATRRELLKVLLGVYMSGGESTMNRTSRLLNSQAINLDVTDVIDLVPPKWPLNTMSSFLACSLRRTLHTRHEGQIIKAISAGQNIEVVDNAYQTLREAGAVIEEPLDSDDGDDENHELLDEKASLLNLSLNASRPEPIPSTNANGADDVAEIRVQSHDSRDTTSTSRSNSVLR
ncbi:uncharacterized protein FOMMEDRAFT_162532 [Fomitiporia mediterranea MF3/22]|uniref:CNH domain-containing protein n=1 Tax=Fomitiporia mediterranea (strain MF3/22) TaxID=694068 RepID=R7SGA7_FOMME|nr:uncharacterized protein FOMMEDRAFT_162532 [Fomitiporia mediterranea MF3/22]EJC97726.1 hypothetical protein FOMMEDRAFT_162532 [Fomitiporia mediterranea MF3/22]